jgi:hypothetical protein
MTAPGGNDIQLSWVPTPLEIHDRMLVKWPDLRMEAMDNECFYYEDEQAKADWVHYGPGGRRTQHKMIHALWNRPGECWIVVDDPKHRTSQWLTGWPEPIRIGDKWDIYDMGDGSADPYFLRTVEITLVTSKSFRTSDGIKWALRGHTPWGPNAAPLKAMREGTKP